MPKVLLAIGIVSITMPVFADTVFDNFKIGAKILLDHSSYDGVHHVRRIDAKATNDDGNAFSLRFQYVF